MSLVSPSRSIPLRVRLRRAAELRLRLLQRNLSHAEARNSALALILIAVAVGLVVGIGVVGLRELVDLMHRAAFDLEPGGHLSDGTPLDPWRVLAVPAAGGLLVGLAALLIRRLRPREIVDAIEANALYGGRMSLTDSLNLTLLSLLSAGCGASVGMEAAYTQLGAGAASRAGRSLKLRRADLRMLVGCGAAAAIAAAYNAPLTGAFYAFELIVGSYTLELLAPVVIAALAGALIARVTFGADPVFVVDQPILLAVGDYPLILLLGIACGGLGILTMKAVTRVEAWLHRSWIPRWLRPALGGLLVGAIAFGFPQVLGSGHGGIQYDLATGFLLPATIGLVIAKIAASAISIGSGFRGGLFSSSLFLGSLFGSLFTLAGSLVWAPLAADHLTFSLVGMGAVGAAIVGAPITMILLVLEGTGNFPVTVAVTVGVLAASITVRHAFGYSFATWRFHIRGLRLRSPEDIGWIQDLTVGRIMRRDPVTVTREQTLDTLRVRLPIGGTRYAFLVDEAGRYQGLVDVSDLHSPDRDAEAGATLVRDLAHHEDDFLLPGENIKLALGRFLAAESEALAVLSDPVERRVVGFVTEDYVRRRYIQELEKRSRGLEAPDPA